MAIKYFPKNVNTDVTCDGSTTPLDMDKTQGSSASQASSGTQSSTFVEVMSFDIDVSGDTPVTSDHDVSVDITDLTDVTARFRLQAIDDAGCGVDNSSSYSSEFTTTGIKTFTLNLTWAGTSDRLRLSCEIKKDAVHGNKAVTINVNDADTFVDALDFGAAGGATPYYYASLIGDP